MAPLLNTFRIARVTALSLMLAFAGLAHAQDSGSESASPPVRELLTTQGNVVDPYEALEDDNFKPIVLSRLPFRLALPINCTPAEDCFILNYFDRDPEVGSARGLKCSPITYDGHLGVDFAVSSLEHMRQGVTVVSAAAGLVKAVRKHMPDIHLDAIGSTVLDPVGLGNAVVMEHADGVRTIYGHLRQNSIMVRPGDVIEQGHPLGLVGLSGLTEHPHVHFEVRIGPIPVDPFGVGTRDITDLLPCQTEGRPFFSNQAVTAFPPVSARVIRSGWSDIPLNHAAMLYGMAERDSLPPNVRNLYFQVQVQGLHRGDHYLLEVRDPQGRAISTNDQTWQQDSAYSLLQGGVSGLTELLEHGTYTGLFLLRRNIDNQERVLIQREHPIVIAPDR